jgi:hypothetical protein
MRKLPTFLLSLCSAFAALIFLSISVTGQGVAPTCASITVSNLTYTQDFDTLTNSGTSSTVPPGFGFAETGTNADTTYTAGTGSSATGDTYSFGVAGSNERAFGGLRSGSLVPTIGACFTNNIGGTINSIQITYDGEQWRLGTAGRQDRLDFQYSLNAVSLTDASATWIDVDPLDFSTPNTTTATGVKDGNAAENRTPGITALIAPLSIPNGATVYIRFLDVDASGSDDGLAIDNFSFTPSSLTAASATISGRITNSAGRGLSFITVTLTGGNLSETKYAMTNNFGYYRFADIQVGEGYLVTAKSKRYVFRQPSVFVGVNQDLTGIDFIGDLRK